MKKFVRLTAFMLSALSLAFIVSCGDDDEEDDGPSVVGSYQFTSAVTAADGPLDATGQVVTDQEGNPLLPTGVDVVEQVNAALLGGAADLCDDAANVRVTLDDSGSLLYTCSNSDASADNGEWQQLSDTDLRLTINFDGIGPIPVDINSLVISETQLSGNIANLPLPGDVIGLPDPLITLNLDVVLARD
ncbi:MAG: hypothetical protein AAGA85_15915 [Bacteroidota bacterium]